MSASAVRLNLSQDTLEEIALNALPLLQALGLGLDESTACKAMSAPALGPQDVDSAVLYDLGDWDPPITWK